MKGRCKSMDTSGHAILDLLIDDEMDQSLHHQYHNHHVECPVIRSISMDGSCHLQLKNRFDAMTKESHNIHSNSNMTDLMFLARTKSPRRPERQPSLIPCNDHNKVSKKGYTNNYDTPAITIASTTNRISHRHPIPSTKQKPPLVVYIHNFHCEGDSISEMSFTTQSLQQQLRPEEKRRSATSPRRPIRQPSCVMKSTMQADPSISTTKEREVSPRRPVRRPSVL